jgi:hypothetical protein
MDVGYDLKWRDVVNNQKIYTDRCILATIPGAMKLGGMTDPEARTYSEGVCQEELTNLKNCMSGDSPSAEKCLPDSEGGD